MCWGLVQAATSPSNASNRTQTPLLLSHPLPWARGPHGSPLPRWGQSPGQPLQKAAYSPEAAGATPSLHPGCPPRPVARTRHPLPEPQAEGWPCQDPIRGRRLRNAHVPTAGSREGAAVWPVRRRKEEPHATSAQSDRSSGRTRKRRKLMTVGSGHVIVGACQSPPHSRHSQDSALMS